MTFFVLGGTSGGSFGGFGRDGLLEEALEHWFAGEGVQPAFGDRGIVGLGAQGFAGGAQPV